MSALSKATERIAMRVVKLIGLVLIAASAGTASAQELTSYVPVRQGFNPDQAAAAQPTKGVAFRSAPYGNYTGVVVWGDPTTCCPCSDAREDLAAMGAKLGY